MKYPALLLTAILYPCVSHAVTINYVDAVVTGMSGTVNTTGPTGTAASATAWRIRGNNGGTDTVPFGNEGSVLQYDTNPIDASNPTLTTTITGLDALKSYQVYVFFWDDGLTTGTPPTATLSPATAGSAWDAAAKLSTDAAYTQFDSTPSGSKFIVTTDTGTVNSASITGSGYTGLTLTDLVGERVLEPSPADMFADAYDGNRALFAGLLPTTITGVTSFSVNIQAGTNTVNRSWYDGVGYAVVPEPSAALLALLGVPTLLRRRR